MARFTFQDEARQSRYEDAQRKQSELFRNTYYGAGFRTAPATSRSKYKPHSSLRELVRANTNRGSTSRKVGMGLARMAGKGDKDAAASLGMVLDTARTLF